MVNFAALDPTIKQKGMRNYSKSDAQIWGEFFSAPSSFIEHLQIVKPTSDFTGEYDQQDKEGHKFNYEMREGIDVERSVKTRTNQSYFRKMLMASYDGKCAITGIRQPDLLIASHIKPWKDDIEARLDPRNGILLNSLHDRAFDKGLITIDEDFNLIRSKQLTLPEMARPFFEGQVFSKPKRFAPDPSFMNYHRERRFLDSPLCKNC